MSIRIPSADFLLRDLWHETVTGLELQFVVVALRQKDDCTPEFVSILALKSYMPVGALKWDLSNGQIMDVWVRPNWRRRKIATVMLEVAGAMAEENEWELPQHSTVRTEEGEAWALASGAEPAETIDSWDDDPEAEAMVGEALRAWPPRSSRSGLDGPMLNGE